MIPFQKHCCHVWAHAQWGLTRRFWTLSFEILFWDHGCFVHTVQMVSVTWKAFIISARQCKYMLCRLYTSLCAKFVCWATEILHQAGLGNHSSFCITANSILSFQMLTECCNKRRDATQWKHRSCSVFLNVFWNQIILYIQLWILHLIRCLFCILNYIYSESISFYLHSKQCPSFLLFRRRVWETLTCCAWVIDCVICVNVW